MYKRIVLKLSGETLAPEKGALSPSTCYDPSRIDGTAKLLCSIRDMGVETGVVLGGGNIWRGRFTDTMDPVAADQMGMLATVMNALALAEAIERAGGKAAVFSAQAMDRFCDLYRADRADEALSRGCVCLFAGGTGNPFFTTDTGCVLRAAELKADAVLKGTNVDGMYSADPRKDPSAVLVRDITYAECVERKLSVMDITAFQICRERRVPCVRIFSMKDLGNILRVLRGEEIGTVVHE